MKRNHYTWTKEHQYKNIQPTIFVEKLLCDKYGHIPNDYKLHMINNKLALVYCSIDREGMNYRKIYDPSWNNNGIKWAPYGTHDSKRWEGPEIDKPENFSHMIKLARILSQGFCYIRIDFYELDGKVYVGEFTQHDQSGNSLIIPVEYDLKYGSLLTHKVSDRNIPY